MTSEFYYTSTGIEDIKDVADDTDDSDLDDDSNDEYDEYDRTLLENYNSCIDKNDEVDEFVVFKDTLQGWYFFICLVIKREF